MVRDPERRQGDDDRTDLELQGDRRGNTAPVAANDAYAVNEDVTLNVAAPGVLSNDSDADGNSLSAVIVSGPSHGALALSANGSFSYTPIANFNGSDSFTYKANDGTADSNVATVTITVTRGQRRAGGGRPGGDDHRGHRQGDHAERDRRGGLAADVCDRDRAARTAR